MADKLELRFEQTLPKITFEFLCKKENEHNVKLPDSYRNFLVEINGGEPNHQYFYTEDDEVHVINDFYGLHPNSDEYYDDVFLLYSESSYPDVFKIAWNESQKCNVMLSLAQEDFGAIYNYFDNDFDAPEPYKEYLFPNFEAFLASAENDIRPEDLL